MENQPLVCIGIPTRNRPGFLKKAVDSCLAQTYKNIIIFISDNCSDNPEVERLCREYAQNDSRIKYVRQEENIGMGANGQYLIDNVVGEYYFTMGDDDWLSENFIEECMNVFLAQPDCSLVCGQVKLYDENYNPAEHNCHAEHMNQDDYIARIEFYYEQLWSFLSYGIRKVSDLKKMDKTEWRSCGDWIDTTKFIFLGKFYVLDSCEYNKLWTGMTGSLDSIKEGFNLPKNLTFNGLMEMYAQICRDAVLNDDFFKENLSKKERIKLARIIYNGITAKKNGALAAIKSLLQYMWQHPLFLSRKSFYKRISDIYEDYYKAPLRYMWRHPLFLFRKSFYNQFTSQEK